MKRLFIIGATLFVLTGCSGVETEVSTEAATEITTEVETEEVTTEEITTEETTKVTEEESTENYLEGYDRYSSEYIEEMYYNTIDNIVSLREWRTFEKMGYSENKIMYCLLKYHREIK